MAATVREATQSDLRPMAEVLSKSFEDHGRKLGTVMPLADMEAATALITLKLTHSTFYCALAEENSRVVGVNFLDERSAISGVGPLAVVPDTQGSGVGKLLMKAVVERAESTGAAGVRLVTAAGNPKSLVLYSRAGFVVREGFAVMSGSISEPFSSYSKVRTASTEDLEPCNLLCRRIHGHERAGELNDGITQGTARVVERGGEIVGYSSSIGSNGHTVAEDNEAICQMISSVEKFNGRGVLVPTKNAELLLWCLDQGLQVQHQVSLMTRGLYNEPRSPYMPSMTY